MTLEALALSDNQRAELAARLIESLDSPVDVDADAAWQDEVARRAEEVRTGKVKTLSRAEVEQKARTRLDEP